MTLYTEVQRAQARKASRAFLPCFPRAVERPLSFPNWPAGCERKALILAHRDELIRQAADKVRMVWPDAVVGVVKGRDNDYRHKNVVCASVQTLSREKRLRQIICEDFGLLVVDEAHHSLGPDLPGHYR